MSSLATGVRRLVRRLRAWWVLLRHGRKTALLLGQRQVPEASNLSDSTGAAEQKPATGPGAGSPQRSRTGVGDTFKLGKAVGQPGGQGAVFEIADNRRLVYKQYHTPFVGAAASFLDLMERADRVNADLPRGVTMTWPIHLCGQGSDVEGYTMTRVADPYFVTIARPNGSTERQLGLGHAVPRKKSVFRPTRLTTPEDRLALARLIGLGLDALHRHDVLYRDMSWANFAYALDPPRIVFMDMDSARPITVPIIMAKDGVDTPDWVDPDNPAEPLGFDLDRYKYALLVHRLLGSHELSGGLPTRQGLVAGHLSLDGVDPRNHKHVADLYRRVAGSPGQRPPISEWLDVLGR